MKRALVISCEHAVNTVPAAYQALFHDSNVLDSHRGIDFGAAHIGQYFQHFFKAPFFKTNVSRLVIDCNRSLHHKDLFSEFTKPLKLKEKEDLIKHYYSPYRHAVLAKIAELVQADFQVIHLSQHSFTPSLNNIERNADIGLLYDSRKQEERLFAAQWRSSLKNIAPHLRVRMNYPYLGLSDGFVTDLRKQFFPHRYLGFEIEVNQSLVQTKQSTLVIAQFLAESLGSLLE